MAKDKQPSRYAALIERVFLDHYRKGLTEFVFERIEIEQIAIDLKMVLPKNLGDLFYSFRYRTPLPKAILDTAPKGKEWIIEGAGKARYSFQLVTLSRVIPREDLIKIKIPDSTPEIISLYALNDEQALLAKIRYNRLIDIFLGLTTYSLQNHLRTTVKDIGQIEIDELYIGLDRSGCHYIIPVQAKAGKDQISVVQTKQDIKWCAQKFPGIACRAISAQFLDNDLIALFDLAIQDDQVRIVEEKHYYLVPANEIDSKAIQNYPTT